MNILGIIPARAGSKGIKDKNIYPCAGKPLTEWTLDTVHDSLITNYIISTDSQKVALKYKHWNVLIRPDYLCMDDTPMSFAVRYAMYQYEANNSKADAIILLQPTSPLRTVDDINDAYLKFLNSNTNSLYSGYYMGIKHKSKVYDKHTSEKHFQRNGAIFIAKRELVEQGKLWDETVIEYEMPLSRSIDIDDMDDMYIAEALLEKRLKEAANNGF